MQSLCGLKAYILMLLAAFLIKQIPEISAFHQPIPYQENIEREYFFNHKAISTPQHVYVDIGWIFIKLYLLYLTDISIS